MEKKDMNKIFEEREELIKFLNSNKCNEENKNYIINSIKHYNRLISKLRLLNVSLLGKSYTEIKINDYPENYFKKGYNYSKEQIEFVREIIECFKDLKYLDSNNFPHLRENNEFLTSVIPLAKKIYKDIFNFENNYAEEIFNPSNIYEHKMSLLYFLCSNSVDLAETFFNPILKKTYILSKKSNTIEDIYTLINPAIFALNLHTAPLPNNYLFSNILADSSNYLLTDYLKENKKYETDAKIKNLILLETLRYNIRSKINNLDKNEINTKSLEHEVRITSMLNSVLKDILGYVLYDIQKQAGNLDLMQKLLYDKSNGDLINYDYNKLGITYDQILESSKKIKTK